MHGKWMVLPLIVLGLVTPIQAQISDNNVPNLSRILAKTELVKPVEADSLIGSGLTVPSVEPGVAARNVGRELVESIEAKVGNKPGLDDLQNKMPAVVSDMERQLNSIGFAKRDMGVAVAYALIYNYETATGKKLSDADSKTAARHIVAAMKSRYGKTFNALSPAEQEKQYETLMATTTLLAALVPVYEKGGKAAEAGEFRQSAARIFARLTGYSPDEATFSKTGFSGPEEGIIVSDSGEPARKAATAEPARKAAPAEKPVNGIKKGQIDSVILHMEPSLGVGGGVYMTFEPYVLLKDGQIFRAPNEALDEFDVAAYARKGSGGYGRYTRSGKTLKIQWNKGKPSTWEGDDYHKAKPGAPGQKLTGHYFTIGGGGNTSLGGDVTVFSSRDFDFYPDGTFSMASAGGGISSTVTAVSSREAKGTYKIDGYTMTIKRADGEVQRRFFYRYPDSDDAIGIGSSTYTKRDKKRNK